MKIISHGIEFIRTGHCKQCGACEDGSCPHHMVIGGLSYCDVYNRRDRSCCECGTDHKSCIGYPDNPWIHLVRRGICGFTFERADGKPMDELPFLWGKPYRMT